MDFGKHEALQLSPSLEYAVRDQERPEQDWEAFPD